MKIITWMKGNVLKQSGMKEKVTPEESKAFIKMYEKELNLSKD